MQDSRINMFLKLGGVCGIVMPILALSLIFLAIGYSSWFRWTGNALSDLGVDGVAAVLFNFGLVISGFLGMIFALGLMYMLKNQKLGLAGAILFALAAVSLVGIGVFSETAGQIHLYFSVVFFASVPLSLFSIGTAMFRNSATRKIGAFSILVSAFAVMVWAIPKPFAGVAIPEMLAALAASTWSIAMGARLLFQTFR